MLILLVNSEHRDTIFVLKYPLGRKGGRSLYYHVESVACLLFTIAIIVATRAIIYLLAFYFPQKMLPSFVFAAFLFSTVTVKGEGDILKVRDNISTLTLN